MKFLTKEDAQMFCIDISEFDLMKTVDATFEPTEEMLELFLKKQRSLIPSIKDFRKAQDSRALWRKKRHLIMKGIKRFHRSTKGKRFHRALGRFLATRESLQTENFCDLSEALKATSSIKTHLYIEHEFYMPYMEYVGFQLLTEIYVPILTGLEKRLFSRNISLNEGEEDLLYRIVEGGALITSFAELSGKTPDEVEKEWDTIKQDLLAQGKSEEDEEFYAYLVSILKTKLGID